MFREHMPHAITQYLNLYEGYGWLKNGGLFETDNKKAHQEMQIATMNCISFERYICIWLI